MSSHVDKDGDAPAAAWLYRGAVFHRRRRPREHSLRYRVFSLLLDIDRIDELVDRIPWFSRNSFNLVSFYDTDFTVDSDPHQRTLRDWVESCLRQSGLHAQPDTVLLSCYPRVIGYAFNPLSVYYCRDASGDTYAVIHEVHNTFGERYAYVLPIANRTVVNELVWIEQSTDKRLFVSPFAKTDLVYKFRLNEPAERQVIVIRAEDADGVLITASYTADRCVLTARHLLMQVLYMPLMTVKVMAGIHYEALKLWIKRIPLLPHVPKSELGPPGPSWHK